MQGSGSRTAKDAGDLNNLENVWFDTAAPGTWTIRVRATEIIGDGVPSVGDATDQDFALVVSNAN